MEGAVKRRQFIAASAAALCLPSIVRGEKRSVLKFVPYGDLSIVDPIWASNTVTRCHAFMVYDTLYGQTGPQQGFAARPQMVAGQTVENNGRTWALTLRDGLLFHDGTKVLARDCVASIRRWGARDAFGQALLQRTDDLSAPDDRTIVFRLSKPFPMLPDALGKYPVNMCAIMPERLAATDPFKQITEVVGSGPFRFKTDERLAGSQYVYERFAEYRPRSEDKPDFLAGPKIVHFDRIEWHIFPEPGAASMALQTGEIDWQESPFPDLVHVLRKSGLVLQPNADLGWSWGIRPNHLHPPFDNPAVRQALLPAVDPPEYMIAAMGTDPAGWTAPSGFFSIGSPMATEIGLEVLRGPRDLGKARLDLKAAGYRGEKIVVITAHEGLINTAMNDVLVDMLKKLGMDVDYQVMDYTSLFQRVLSRKAPAQGGWNIRVTAAPGLDWMTPATHLLLRGNGEKSPGTGWPTSPKLEALRDAWFDAPDFAAQKRICTEIQIQAFVDLPYIPLGTSYTPMAHRADLAGISDGQIVFWNVRRRE
jgi:peptide/nickel transport system substrate-binding protein